MRRTFGPSCSQRSKSGLLTISTSLSAVLGQPTTYGQLLNAGAPDDQDVQPKTKVPASSTPKLKVSCLSDQVSEAREQPTVSNRASKCSTSCVQMSEETVAHTIRPNFSTPLAKAHSPLENYTRFTSLPETISSPLGNPLGDGNCQLAECNNRDEQKYFR